MSDYIKRYKLEVEIQDNGLIRDPFGWIVGRCDKEWFNAVVRHEPPERTCKVEKLVEGKTPDGYQAYGWHCLSCGGKMFGGDYALYGHVPPKFCQHCGAKVVER